MILSFRLRSLLSPIHHAPRNNLLVLSIIILVCIEINTTF